MGWSLLPGRGKFGGSWSTFIGWSLLPGGGKFGGRLSKSMG